MNHRARAAARLGFVVTAIVAIAACTPTVAFYGDGILRAIDGPDLERSLRSVAREVDQRLIVEWDPSPELGTAWLESRLQANGPALVILSPYFSLFSTDFSERYPEIDFVAFGPAGRGDRLTHVLYDRVPAFEEAGRNLARWVDAGPDRSIAALFVTGTEEGEDELDALRAAFDDLPERISVREFSSVPDRETTRSAVRDLLLRGCNGFVVHLGSASRYAVEILQSEPVVYGTDSARLLATGADALLYSIEQPLDEGVRAALEAPPGGTVVVQARFEPGPGFDNPQFVTRGTAPEETD